MTETRIKGNRYDLVVELPEQDGSIVVNIMESGKSPGIDTPEACFVARRVDALPDTVKDACDIWKFYEESEFQ